MTVCSLSEVLAEGVDCDRWVWWVTGASCILVLGACCCIVGFYWDLLCCRRNRRSQTCTGAKGGKGNSLEEDVPPSVLCVDSPNQHKECSGSYDLLEHKVNGHPVWQKRGMERWLYSGFDGRWYICGSASKERNFDCASGYIYNKTFHKGTLPHHLGSSWEWSGGLQWHRDAAIVVYLPDPDEAPSPRRQLKAYASPGSSQVLIMGPHNMTIGSGLKTMPIAENRQQQFNSNAHAFCQGEAPTVFGAAQPKETEVLAFERYKASKSKSWGSIHGVLDKFGGAKRDNMSDDSTLDSSSILASNCDMSTEGSYSLKSPRSSQPISAQGFPCSGSSTTRSESSDATSNTSSRRSMVKEPPQLLCVITPNGQRECAGTYEFVSGETANGRPLWKQQDGERWLYSSTSGRWCIGGQDVKEDNFQRHAGYISQTAPHKGTMPDRTSSIWQRWDSEKFVKDTRITIVQLHPPRSKDNDSRRPKEGEKLDLRGKSADDSLKKQIREDDVVAIVV